MCFPTFRVAVSIVAVAGLSVPASAEQLAALMVRSPMSSPSTLYRMPITTTPQGSYSFGAPALVGPLGGQVVGTALAPSGQLLALDPSTDRLLWVNSLTGATIDSVPLDLDLPTDSLSDLAVSPTGQAWLVTQTDTSLYALSITSGATQVITDTGLHLRNLTWLDGRLYGGGVGIAENGVFSIDPVTGQSSILVGFGGGSFGDYHIVHGVGSHGSRLMVSVGHYIPAPSYYWVLSVDPSTGVTELLGDLEEYPGEGFEILRVGGADAPIPALGPVGIAVLALLIAGGGVVLLRRG